MISRGNRMATASVAGMASVSRGVAMTPIPVPNPPLAIPNIITAGTAHNQKVGA